MSALARLASALALAGLGPILAVGPCVAQQPAKPDAPKKIPAYEAQFPKGMNWVLSTISGQPPQAEATLHLDENLRGSGATGCNTFSAAIYPIRGMQLAMGPVAMTKKMCAPPLMAQERQFLTILATRPTWKQEGYTLTLSSKAGTLVFNRGL